MRVLTAVAAATLLATGLAGCAGAATDSARSRAPAEQDIVRRTVTETRSIPFEVKRVKDPSLDKGTRRVRVRGVDGERRLTYRVTLTDGERTGKRLRDSEVTKRPVTRVVVIGTKVDPPDCDPNYDGGCVPIAYDVDCDGGSGDGPAYVAGPVRVVGSDVYELDSDGDGYGCESD